MLGATYAVETLCLKLALHRWSWRRRLGLHLSAPVHHKPPQVERDI